MCRRRKAQSGTGSGRREAKCRPKEEAIGQGGGAIEGGERVG